MSGGFGLSQRSSTWTRIFHLCITVVLLGFIYLMFQRVIHRFLYYPARYPGGEWYVQKQAGAEDVWLTAADGVRLNAWWFPAPGSRYVTLFLHGNAGNVTHRVDH